MTALYDYPAAKTHSPPFSCALRYHFLLSACTNEHGRQAGILLLGYLNKDRGLREDKAPSRNYTVERVDRITRSAPSSIRGDNRITRECKQTLRLEIVRLIILIVVALLAYDL